MLYNDTKSKDEKRLGFRLSTWVKTKQKLSKSVQGAPKFIILLTKIEVLPIIFPPKKLSNGNKAFAMYILPAAHVFEMPNLKRWNFFLAVHNFDKKR